MFKVPELLKHCSLCLLSFLSEQQMQDMWLLKGTSSAKENKGKQTKCHARPLLASYATSVLGEPHYISGVDDVTRD